MEIQVTHQRRNGMIACIKTILLTLMLFLPSYSQQGGIEDMQVWLTGKSHGSYIRMPERVPNINGDTLILKHDESYALFSGMLSNSPKEGNKAKYASEAPYLNIKINNVIRGNIDTTNHPSIALGALEVRCPNNKFEIGKNYLMLDYIVHDRGSIVPKITCENILPDTPENREKLIKEYEKKVIINEPKPKGK